MPDKSNKPVAAIAKPALVTPPRHDPVPSSEAAAKPATAVPPAKSVAPDAVDAKPAARVTDAAKAAPAPKPATPAAAKVAAEPVKRKRGRPLGSKTVAKVAVAKPPVAKAAPAKPAFAAKPVHPKPIKTPTKSVAPLAVATINEGQKTMTDTITKIQDTAKKFTDDAGVHTQAMFGDMSAKAKGAYEKSVKMTEELTEFHKGNVEAMVESSKLAAKAAETLGQSAADYARKSFEHSTAAFKTFASAKSPTELFKLQSDYMKSYFDSAVAEGTKVTESWLKLAGDVAQPLSNRVAVAVEKVKATAAI